MSLTKLEVLNLDLSIWSYEIYKTALKLEFLNYHMNTQPLTCGTRVSADPTRQRDENRGGARDCAAVVELADGEDSGEAEGTGMLTSMNCIYTCPTRNLYRARTPTATCNGGRWRSPATLRQSPAE